MSELRLQKHALRSDGRHLVPTNRRTEKIRAYCTASGRPAVA